MLIGGSVGIDRKKAQRQASAIRKRTPLEQAIAEQTDPRIRWDAKKREEGFKRTTMMVRTEAIPEVKAVVRLLNRGEGDVQSRLRDLVAQLEG